MFKDIEPIITIDLTIYYYILGISFLFFLLVVIKFLKNSKKVDSNLKSLQSIDIEHLDKNQLYNFTILSKEYLNSECKDRLILALKLIKPYKYKKSLESVSKEAKDAIREFLKCIK